MRKFYSVMMMACMLTASMTSWAINPPVGVSELADGEVYAFQNVHKMSNWLGHTSWDGALYYNNADASNFVKLKAVKNLDDGTWSFIEVLEDTIVKYAVIPNGTDNLNTKILDQCPDPLTIPCFTVETYADGVLGLIVGEGNNNNCVGRPVHMNAGNEYVVASEPVNGGGWYPDFYGGALLDEFGEKVYQDEESDLIVMADSTTCHWNFVKIDDLASYMGKGEAYTAIYNFKSDYLDNEETDAAYTAGLQATYDAVCTIYDNADYEYGADNPVILAMINNKVSLYKEILLALEVNTDDNLILTAATNNAKGVFDGTTDADALQTAYETLCDAVLMYQQGTGDLTSLIQNNSFEDLSSQSGNTTTGVEGAPTGWNVYVGGKQVVSAADVKGAGIANWHGINADAGGVKDGSYAFGIWTSGIPEYEISQTISGLENGTYIIGAALMAGANGSGSRMTTQRIFGNLNSVYFGTAEDYDLEQLDKSELPTFQGNDQYYATDTELFPMELKAYVYDGTLTLGLRTDGNYKAALRSNSNSAGGDGWFKVDNFQLQKVGYVAADAMEILDYFVENLETYYNADAMNSDLRDDLGSKLDAYSNIDEDTPAEDINAAILETRDLIVEVSADIKAYETLDEAIQAAWSSVEEYIDYPGFADYQLAIEEIETNYAEGVYTTDECADAIQALADALQACIESNVVEPGKDITNWIKNPSFEDQTSQGGSNSDGVAAPPTGWSIIIDGDTCLTQADMTSHVQGWCAINSGDNINIEDGEGNIWEHQYTDGEHLWGVWSGAVPTIELYQELNLPAGTYKLSADVVVQNDWAGYNLATQRLFAGDYVTMFGAEDCYATYLPEDALDAKQHDEWTPDAEYKRLSYADNYKEVSYDISGIPYTTVVYFGTEGDGPVKVGFRTDRTDLTTGELSSQASKGWFKLDNFRLECVSLDVPDVIGSVAEKSEAKDGVMYNMAGQIVDGSYKGFVILNGKKQLVK